MQRVYNHDEHSSTASESQFKSWSLPSSPLTTNFPYFILLTSSSALQNALFVRPQSATTIQRNKVKTVSMCVRLCMYELARKNETRRRRRKENETTQSKPVLKLSSLFVVQCSWVEMQLLRSQSPPTLSHSFAISFHLVRRPPHPSLSFSLQLIFLSLSYSLIRQYIYFLQAVKLFSLFCTCVKR